MTDFLKNRSKLVVMLYAVVLALIVLAALLFMINLANVHIAYTVDSAGVKSIDPDSQFSSTQMYNSMFFEYFDFSDTTFGYDAYDAAEKIYDFQIAMSSFNTFLIVYAVIAYIAFAIMLIFSNHSRKVYYKSNLFAGILMPFIIIVFGIISLIRNFGLLANFNENYDLYRLTSFLMDPKIQDGTKTLAQEDYNIVLENSTRCNSLGFTIATVACVIVIIYSALMIVYTIFRYKECAKRRNDILERAANNND